MTAYLIRRLFLLPITLFAIILVNFVILNIAPGDPVTVAEISESGEASRSNSSMQQAAEQQYLQFREFYGLTLPVLFNHWPATSFEKVHKALHALTFDKQKMNASHYHKVRSHWGDRARFVMPHLLTIAKDPNAPLALRRVAVDLFIRGGTRQGHVGPKLSSAMRQENGKIARDNIYLAQARLLHDDTAKSALVKIQALQTWYDENAQEQRFTPTKVEKASLFFFETRFSRYLSRVLRLDFGVLRNDANRRVIHEVGKRIKYSLTLALLPMLITFVLCQCFGMWMATKHNRLPDIGLNLLFLMLFAIPIFVVAPFLIEKVALGRTIPFTNIPIPYSGFHSPASTYALLTSRQRLADTALHIFLPLVAIMYGTLAVQARLSRTAVLEVLRQDYVRTAKAKGLARKTILIKHVGRNAAITIVTSLAASLGIILGGSLIVETIFEINGFGRFFYEAILNRDYNVILFSAFAGSFLTLLGYLLADIAYTLLDPRVTLEA